MTGKNDNNHLSDEAKAVSKQLGDASLRLHEMQNDFVMVDGMMKRYNVLDEIFMSNCETVLEEREIISMAFSESSCLVDDLSKREAAGVPSRSEGAAADGMPSQSGRFMHATHFAHAPASNMSGFSATSGSSSAMQGAHVAPFDNMGVTKYLTRNPESPDASYHPCMGGYDGGVEIGFGGDWQPAALTQLKETLEEAKRLAEERHGEPAYVTIAGRVFCILPRGSSKVHYRFVLEGVRH